MDLASMKKWGHWCALKPDQSLDAQVVKRQAEVKCPVPPGLLLVHAHSYFLMSSPASERPPRDTTTSRPYSTMKSDAPRRTGPRVKIPDEPVITETNSVLPETNSVLPETNSVLPETSDVSPRASVPPESLRKPYASLVPQKRTDVEKVTNSARPGVASDTESPNPAPVWDDSSSVTSGTGITSTATKTQKNANQCRKHGIQKNAAGVCMMCRKEQNESDEGTTWKMIIAVLVVAILGSGIAAVMI